MFPVSNNLNHILVFAVILCGAGFFAGFSVGGGGFASIDNHARWAFACRCFSCFRRGIFFIVKFGKVVFNRENFGLLFAKTAANAADLAHRAGVLAGFKIAAGD